MSWLKLVTVTVLSAGTLLAGARRFREDVFPDVIRVDGFGVEHTASRQVQGQGPQAGEVGLTAGMDVEIDRRAVGRGHNLDLEAVNPAAFPVVCFDERPCFLLGDVDEGLPPHPGKPAREHYAYTRHGSCCVLAAVEPLTSQRLYQVRAQRTKSKCTPFVQQLAARHPRAEKIRLVQDNPNTHALSTFSDCLPAALAQRLAERFAVY